MSYAKQAMKYIRTPIGAAGKMGRRAGTAFANTKYAHSQRYNPVMLGGIGATMGRGAAVGAFVGGGTAIPDGDRSVIPGVIGGAFWGAIGGIGGRAALGRRMNSGIAMNPGTNVRALRRGTLGGGMLTGAYGLAALPFGRSRRRKSHGTFHHGERM